MGVSVGYFVTNSVDIVEGAMFSDVDFSATMTCPSWVALHGMAHSFIELDKAVVHVIRLVSFL